MNFSHDKFVLAPKVCGVLARMEINMAIQKDILIDQNQREIIDRDNAGILYQFNEVYYDLYFKEHVPWHWHEFIEVAYVLDGSIEYSFPEKRLLLHKGDILFINSNVLHAVLPKEEKIHCSIFEVLFDYHFLSGKSNSDIESKYFLPLLGCSAIPGAVFHPESSQTATMTHEFMQAMEEDKEGKYGYEFRVQSHLSSLWIEFLKELRPTIEEAKPQNIVSYKRLKTMMQYIQEHYMEKMSLEDIASSANISKRECSRCFHINLNETPLDFLNRYRTDMAVSMLLYSDTSIMTISENCGFRSASYFSKVFRDLMNCTPKQFQTKNRKG